MAQNGHDIRVTAKSFKNDYLYLGYYLGKGQYLLDSARADATGTASFKGKEKLPGGIYFIVFPGKRNFVEILIDKNQAFSMQTDTGDVISKTSFVNSPENDHYKDYQKFIAKVGNEIMAQEAEVRNAKNAKDSAAAQEKLSKTRLSIQNWRDDFNKKYPTEILSALFRALKEPVIPPAEQQPGKKYDTLFVYNYYKQHYWDGVSFSDERLIRSPFFEPKLDKYFDNVLLGAAPDTLMKECDKMLDEASRNKEMYKYLLDKFTRKYINPTYMGQDAVFVHLFERYYANGSADYWMDEKYRKQVFDRAYSLMANLIGGKAANLEMVDTSAALKKLYDVNSKYTLVCFWDPTCGHCQKEIPQLDSLYREKWKKIGVTIYGVMVDGGKDNWTKYIREHNLAGWLHVYQTKEMKDAEMNSGLPGYKQLYDVFQTPTLYLLDKDKRIIAKRLNPEQLDQLLDNMQKKTTN